MHHKLKKDAPIGPAKRMPRFWLTCDRRCTRGGSPRRQGMLAAHPQEIVVTRCEGGSVVWHTRWFLPGGRTNRTHSPVHLSRDILPRRSAGRTVACQDKHRIYDSRISSA